MLAVLNAVAAAPPPAFSGGGYWEAMHGEMTGFFEVRVDGPGRRHFRLYKPFRTVLSRADYAEVRALGAEFRSRVPRIVDT